MYLNQKKWIAMLFSIKSSFKFPALAMPKEVDRVTKDWWRMTSLQEYLKAFCFYFACFMSALLSQLQFFCVLSRKTPHHYWNNIFLNKKDFVIPDLTSRPIQKPSTLFCTDTRSSSLGLAEAGTLKLDLRALKCQNPIFFLRIPYSATIVLKTLLAV